MSVTDLRTDIAAGTMTIVAEYPASADRVWELWADPRRLEQWWGPPSYPATVTDHDFSPGGLVTYYMTGPEGDRYHGGWRVVHAAAPHRLEFEDYFADTDGNEDTSLPASTTTVTITERDDGTTEMVIDSRYPSSEALRRVIEMGREEGIRAALGQIDELLSP